MKAQAIFFHQGQELYQDCEPYMKDIASQVRVSFFKFINIHQYANEIILIFYHWMKGLVKLYFTLLLICRLSEMIVLLCVCLGGGGLKMQKEWQTVETLIRLLLAKPQ